MVKTVLKIDGMACRLCEAHVKQGFCGEKGHLLPHKGENGNPFGTASGGKQTQNGH